MNSSKLGRLVNKLEDRLAVQRYLNWTQKWANSNLMTSHKANCKPCSQRAESPGTSTCHLRCSCADEDLGLLLDKLNMSQECTRVAKAANGTLGLHWQECGQQVKEDVSLPHCSALLNPPRVLCSASSSLVEDTNTLECNQQSHQDCQRDMMHWERLEEMHWFSLKTEILPPIRMLQVEIVEGVPF